MKENSASVKLSRREFLKVSMLSIAGGAILAECQRYISTATRTGDRIPFSSWGQGNVTFAELDQSFDYYAFSNLTGYRSNISSAR